MNTQLLDIYSDYLICSFGQTTATGLSALPAGSLSHDQITRFLRWKQSGLWQKLHDALREQVRVQEGRHPTPSAAIVDSQTVKTTEKGGPKPLRKLSVMTRARRSKAANAISW